MRKGVKKTTECVECNSTEKKSKKSKTDLKQVTASWKQNVDTEKTVTNLWNGTIQLMKGINGLCNGICNMKNEVKRWKTEKTRSKLALVWARILKKCQSQTGKRSCTHSTCWSGRESRKGWGGSKLHELKGSQTHILYEKPQKTGPKWPKSTSPAITGAPLGSQPCSPGRFEWLLKGCMDGWRK